MPEAPGKPQHFTEAIDFLRDKVNVPTKTWTDIWQGMHSRAFVVAGAQKTALIEDFHEAINSAIANGTTLADFRKDFDRIVATHGWSYNGSRNWRSNVIFQTNLRSAYNAGRWEQAQRVKARRPYLRYVAVMDERTRPEHRAWHGTILPVDDPWWETHYPPNGWNCRCTVQSVSQDDIDRNGWEVSGGAPPSPMEIKSINTPDGPVAVRVPEGIDPGFAYNPGEAAFGRGAALNAIERHAGFDELSAPGLSKPALSVLTPARPQASLARAARDEDDLRRILRDAIGGDEAYFDDPRGHTVNVSQALADHILAKGTPDLARSRFFPLIPEAVQEPHEIWIGFAKSKASGRVKLRRRYVRAVALDKNRSVLMVADEEDGYWQAVTFLPVQHRDLDKIRSGYRVFEKGS